MKKLPPSECMKAAASPVVPSSAPNANQGQPASDESWFLPGAVEEIAAKTSEPEETSFCAFTPERLGTYLERFDLLARALSDTRDARAALRKVEEEFKWAAAQSGAPPARDRYRAALSVLADLLSQSWSWRFREHRLELAPPDFTAPPKKPADVTRQKEAIRESMRAERIAQLQIPSTRRFLEEMERPRCRDTEAFSVLNLIANGEELARDLKSLAQVKGEQRNEALQRVVQPYLQLVAGDEVCELTGFRLIDIWRYFRYYWSLPYFSTPGRNLFYLVRDGARPFHPVMGIAALGNSMIRLGDRDRWIGWGVESIEERVLKRAADPEQARLFKGQLATRLYAEIHRAIGGIDPTGLVTARELENPTDRVIRKLLDRAKTSAHRRVETLRAHEQDLKKDRSLPKRMRPRDPAETMYASSDRKNDKNLADHSVEDLYEQKRATELADLLRAKMQFLLVGVEIDSASSVDRLLSSEEGKRAITVALKAIKKQHVGTSMMDIIICGAIPPYSHILGGKLVCMLLAGSQVRRDYYERYSNFPSEIASKMKGELVAKPAELVFLGTTSLYHVGSSQYNRVRIPASIAGGIGEIRYEELGETRGYGSVHFSDRSRGLLEDIVKEEKGATLITRTFGEGVNPKLRLVREGLGCIGVDQDRFLQHRCRRMIYGVALARNTREYLRCEASDPQYYLPGESEAAAKKCTQAIATYWARRWLSQRIENEVFLERIAMSRRDDLRMSVTADRGLSGPGNGGRPLIQGARMVEPGISTDDPGDAAVKSMIPPPSAGPIGVQFIQRLYNHRSCYADRLTGEQMAAIHVETPLEGFILDTLKRGRDIVLTGNPGDGKTHLIMRLMPSLNALGAEHHVDATAEESYEVIIQAWQRARKRKKPFCLAINEWPLLELVRGFADKFPALKEVREQVERGVIYDELGAPPADGVVVVDLNNRNLVDQVVFKRLLTTLTDERFYPECPRCPARETCDVPKARRVLIRDRVRDRLFSLLELVTKRGHHVTMRDLQGFIAFLITGGRSCAVLVAAQEPSPYYTLAFEGESDLFDAIREAFDPAHVTHPAYDEALWTGALPPDGWMEPKASPAPPAAAPGDQVAAMRATKRRFFLEHADGAGLLQLLPRDERRFFEALSVAPEQSERVVRELIRLINRFFDPRDDSDAALRLWSRHCYDARWSPTYVSVRAVPVEVFKLKIPRLPPTTAPAHAYQPDHVLLAAHHGGHAVAQLTVDLSLYRTLFDAQRGLPMALRSPEVLKRLDLFFNELGRAFRAQHEIEDVHIKNFETGENLRFKVDRRNRRYSV